MGSVPDFLPRVVPFAVFIGFIALQPVAAGFIDADGWVVLRGVAAALLLAVFWRSYSELRIAVSWREVVLGVAIGWLVFAAWIAFDAGWATVGSPSSFDPRRPDGSLDAALVAGRIFGMALAVPVMEELFWRSFLMRWIDRRDFLAKDPRTVSALAFGLSCALFASEHALWFAGLLAGAAYALLYMRTRNLWIPILSHATTNGTLAIWILSTQSWHLW